MTENTKLNEKEFLEYCLKKHELKSPKIMQGHEDIKKIFAEIEKRINSLEDKINVKKIKDKWYF